MKLSDFTNFLLPDFSDPIQSVFFGIMFSLTIGIIICAHIYACDVKWDKKWTGEVGQSNNENLDIEHGSVMDLSHAVATAPEKLADVMPGLLLIIGLLGTFLGLGLALDNASNILSKPDSLSATAASNSMQDLLNMLQGLGTKFKTSTWGIIAFIVLKTWSEITRFEEKRLSWVIRKVKLELDFRKQEVKSEEEAKTVRIIKAISDGSKQTADAFTGCMASILELLTQQDHARIERQMSNNNRFNEFATQQNSLISGVGESLNKSLITLTEVIVENNQKSEHLTSNLLSVVQSGFDGIGMHLDGIRVDLTQQEKARIERQRSNNNRFNEFATQQNSLISSVGESLNKSLKILNGVIYENNKKSELRSSEFLNVVKGRFDGIGELLKGIRVDLETSSKAITEFSKNTQFLITEMSKASSQMAEGARGVGVAASGLVETVQAFESKFTEVLDQIGADLGKAINEMSQQAATTLENGSNKLHEATSEISTALGKLSDDVQGTMQQVQGSITEALDIQNKTAFAFKTSSDMLSEQIQNSIDITKKLTTPIELGLKAISESNREQAALSRKLEGSIRTFQEMSETLSTFNKLITPIESISEVLRISLAKLYGINDSVTSLANSEGYHDIINSIKNSIQHLEKQSSLILTAFESKSSETISLAES